MVENSLSSSSNSPGEVTRLLQRLQTGNREVVDALLPLVYDQLRSLARRHLRSERPDHTLNATALVHEAYLKLVDQSATNWQNRAHFFAIAAQAMRRILITYARKRNADKRGGGDVRVTLNEAVLPAEQRSEQLLVIDHALVHLKELNERQAQVVEYSFFGGLTQEEISEVLGVSVPTVRRDWRLARAFLSRELGKTL